MYSPTNLTLSQQKLLAQRSGSQFSDNFFIRCNIVVTNPVFDGLAASLLNWVSFYFVGDALIFMLLALPLIFIIHSEGKQRKMQLFYFKIYGGIIQLLIISGLSLIITTLLSRLIKSESPCVEAKNSVLIPFGANFQCPSFNVVFTAAASYFLYGVKLKNDSEYDEGVKTTLQKIIARKDTIFLKLVATLYTIFFFIVDVILGKSSIIQACFSVCVGLLIGMITEFLSMIIILVVFALLFIASIFYFIYTPRTTNFPTIFDESWRMLLLGMCYIIYTSYVLIRYIIYKKDKQIMKRISESHENNGQSTDTGEAIYAEFDDEVDRSDNLRDYLNRDIFDGAIGLGSFIFLRFVIDTILTWLPEA